VSLQADELRRREQQVREGDRHDGVHRARIACRRLRSALATFAPLLPRDTSGPVREELRWLTRVLGDARDPYVSWQRVEELLEAEPPDDAVRERIRTTYAARIAAGEAPLAEALASARHLALLERLDRLVTDPPWTPVAERPAADVLPRLVADDWRRLEARMVAAADAADQDEALHDARKAAKRLRYAAETLRPVWGGDARALGEAARGLSEHLGERQDLLLVRTDLSRIAEQARAAGESSECWGVLLRTADERRRQLDLGLGDAWQRLARPELRRWLV
jgi:CHAD domain-containing protein